MGRFEICAEADGIVFNGRCEIEGQEGVHRYVWIWVRKHIGFL